MLTFLPLTHRHRQVFGSTGPRARFPQVLGRGAAWPCKRWAGLKPVLGADPPRPEAVEKGWVGECAGLGGAQGGVEGLSLLSSVRQVSLAPSLSFVPHLLTNCEPCHPPPPPRFSAVRRRGDKTKLGKA